VSSLLSEEWPSAHLGDFVANRSKGIVPNKFPDQVFELYSVPSFGTGVPEIIEGKEIGSNKQMVDDGTVLLSKINPRINRSWIVSPHSKNTKIASTEWITFPPHEAFKPKYLAYFLKQNAVRVFLAANASGVGGSLMRVKPATVKDYPFPLAPTEQQDRIVEEIEKQFSRLDEAVANLKRVKANLKRYKASVLQAAVTGKLTEEWRKQHLPAPVTELGKFYTYAILCEDDSIYIGHTNDIERRWREHREGQGAEWTKERKPVKIAHYEVFDSREEAAKREKWFKTGFGRKWIKRELAAGRTRQAGDVEPASKLLERILTERRQKWEETELAKMRAKGLPAPKDGVWWLYVILCDDDSFYIGVTSDMPRRWSEHTGGKGAEWTKKHKPVLIIHHEKFCSQDDAYNREKELKTGFGRKWLKREYVHGCLRQAGKEPKNDKWKEKYKEPVTPDVSGLSDLPDGWMWSTFEQVSKRVTVGHVGPMRNEYTDSGVPFLRSQNVRENKYDSKGLKFISPEFHRRLSKSALRPDDMVVVRSGSVGVTCIIPESLTEANCSDLVIVKQPRAIWPQFGAFYMNSIVNTHVAAQKVGIALTHFNTKSVAAMPVPLPSFEEQKAIVQEVESRLTVAEKIELTVDANLKRAERLRQSILKQAFSGKLV